MAVSMPKTGYSFKIGDSTQTVEAGAPLLQYSMQYPTTDYESKLTIPTQGVANPTPAADALYANAAKVLAAAQAKQAPGPQGRFSAVLANRMMRRPNGGA